MKDTKDINYTITFFSEWQCGSGLAAGADVDVLAIRDKDGLPYVPGKTVKGLVREAIETLYDFQKKDKSALIEIFGNSKDKNNKKIEDSDDNHTSLLMEKGKSFFTNAVMDKTLADKIKDNHAVEYLYRSVASTSILNNGIAQKHSLRKVETVVPVTLHGEILEVPDSLVEDINDALRYIKRLGSGRNRGLGRCDIKVGGEK
jgi:CRISPR/Cas system CSM-associated protein Csm3 (group 7 of RAMP superfamily)